jgi:hypothetical protein
MELHDAIRKFLEVQDDRYNSYQFLLLHLALVLSVLVNLPFFGILIFLFFRNLKLTQREGILYLKCSA